MEKGLKIANRILISLVTLLTIIFSITYFTIYFKNGGFAYKYRILILIASAVLILFDCVSLIKSLKITTKSTKTILIISSIINILISIFSIYFYLDTPEKYITKVNQSLVIYMISYILSCGYIVIENIFENKIKIDKTNIVTFILILLITFLNLSIEKKPYVLNLGILSVTILSLLIIIKNWNIYINDKIFTFIPIIFIIASVTIYLISGIKFQHNFDTIEDYTRSTFVNLIAILLTIISLIITLNKKTSILEKIIELILLTLSILIFFVILKDKAALLEEMKNINIFRILSILVIYLYGIKLNTKGILKKNIIIIITSIATLLLSVIFMILTIKEINELYYIFFKQIEIYALIGLITLIINLFIVQLINKSIKE